MVKQNWYFGFSNFKLFCCSWRDLNIQPTATTNNKNKKNDNIWVTWTWNLIHLRRLCLLVTGFIYLYFLLKSFHDRWSWSTQNSNFSLSVYFTSILVSGKSKYFFWYMLIRRYLFENTRTLEIHGVCNTGLHFLEVSKSKVTSKTTLDLGGILKTYTHTVSMKATRFCNAAHLSTVNSHTLSVSSRNIKFKWKTLGHLVRQSHIQSLDFSFLFFWRGRVGGAASKHTNTHIIKIFI